MASNYLATYKRFNGVDWDTFYFTTLASQVAETTTRKWLSDTQQGWINSYLDPTKFNLAGGLVQLDGNGELPLSAIPGGLDYLPTSGGAMTGAIDMNQNALSDLLTLAFTSKGIVVTAKDDELEFNINGDILSFVTGATSGIDMKSLGIFNLANPVNAQDAVTRAWVEQLVSQGTHVVDAVVVASTVNVDTLSGTTTLDGVALAAGDRVLLKNQTTATENGVYIVNAGAWTKLADSSDTGSLAFVLEGTTNQGTQYYCNADNSWALFFVQDTYFATVSGGLELDGSGFGIGIKAGGVTNAMLAGSIANSKLDDIAATKVAHWASADIGTIVQASTSYGLDDHVQNLYRMIKAIKGTVGAHTTQTDSLTTLKALADTKNRTYKGTANPSTSGYTEGDIYLQHQA